MKQKKYTLKIMATLVAFSVIISCSKDLPVTNELQAETDEELSGGINGTVWDISNNAFGYQVGGLSAQQQLDFFVGNSFFNQNWVEAPSSTTARDGLGPLFNSRSCAGCHFKDGRGRPPLFLGETGTGFLIRLSISGTDQNNNSNPDPSYGGQIQDQGIQNVNPEATVAISYVEIPGTFPDGENYSLQVPFYNFNNLAYGSLAGDIMTSPRVAQQMIGLGLIESIPEHAILANADEFDSNQDGISGKANYVWNKSSQNTTLGKFGWKANQPDLYQQTCGAFLGDMGITTWLFPDENCTSPQSDCQNAINGGTPEIDLSDLEKVVLYVRTLAVPARRNWNNENVLKGKSIFNEIGCDKCHTPKFTTGYNNDIPALSNQVIRPYSDFLLHDMGSGLADNRNDFLANGNEWRTQPLWGLGLIETVNGHTNLLHDGRARNITEAILWHGGEAENSKNKFMNLSSGERNQLILFLNSL